MAPRPYILNELTWNTVRDVRYEVAVLPWGATEAHNFHLPYSTDNIETERIAALAARHASERGARVVVLPVVPFGVNTGQLDIPLCLNLNPSTQARAPVQDPRAAGGVGLGAAALASGDRRHRRREPRGRDRGQGTEVRGGGEREDRGLPGGAGAGRCGTDVRVSGFTASPPGPELQRACPVVQPRAHCRSG